MGSLHVLDELPPGFDVRRGARGVMALRAGAEPVLDAAGFGPDADGRLGDSGLSGRAPLASLEGAGQRCVVRAFRHGGLLRWLTGRRFRDPARPFRELIGSERLRGAGLPTPEVLAARARRAPLGGWHLTLVTRRVEGAVDLGHLLGRHRRGELEPGELRPVLRGAGELVARLHALGFLHADLNPNNLLVVPAPPGGAGPDLWVCDLDRSVFDAPLDEARRLANLRRLYRHVERREERHGRSLSRSDLARFLRSYDPARWRQHWRAIAAAHARRSVWHRLGWWLEERARPAPDPRHGAASRIRQDSEAS